MGKLPYRTWVGMMMFWTTALNYCFRTFFPVTLIAMIKRNDSEIIVNGTSTFNPQPNYGPRYSWTPFQEGQLIGAYFYGYTISSLPGGPIAEFFGATWTIAVSSALCALFTVLSVFLIAESWVPLFICRLLVGLAGGVQYPALHNLIGVWSPPNEKGKFVACLMGNVLGSILTQTIVGAMIGTFSNWSLGFYVTVICTGIFLLTWMLLISDYPEQNRFCSAEEAAYIAETHSGSVRRGKSKPPILKLITSVPFLILLICQSGNLWGLYMLLTVVPKFMADVLKFNLKHLGALSSLPSLSRLIFGFVFGVAADILLKKAILQKVQIRKGFILFSHILPGFTLFLYLVIGEQVVIAVTLLVMVMAFNGATVVTSLVNAQDLAPNFAGTQFGIINCIGSMSGFIIPAMVAEITKERSGPSEWGIIFGVSGTIYIVSGVLFIAFGSVKLQPWNEKTEPNPPQES